MSHNLKERLKRIERATSTKTNGVHPRFWDALCGEFPIEQLDPETRKLVESLYGASPDVPDPIEEYISKFDAE